MDRFEYNISLRYDLIDFYPHTEWDGKHIFRADFIKDVKDWCVENNINFVFEQHGRHKLYHVSVIFQSENDLVLFKLRWN